MVKTILIVGAGASIGDTVVGAFCARNYRVIATGRSALPSTGGNEGVQTALMDLIDAPSRKGLIDTLLQTGVRLDAVVMLAGTINGEPLNWYDDDRAHAIMTANFTGQALFVKEVAALIKPRGRLILLGSIASERGSFDPLYAASKGAMLPFAKSIATAYGKSFSTITVLPGPIENSTMYNEMDPAVQARHRDQSPTGELLNPADLGEILADLAEPYWRHANGTILRVNEGSYV
jgi:3-oxoacyl-[acyl-carrier protein] reductase